MNKEKKLKYYYSFQSQLKSITYFFYKKYRYSWKFNWNEIKNMVDLEFFIQLPNFIFNNKINEKWLYIELKQNIKNQIRDLYFTNKSGKLFLNKSFTKIENELNNTSYLIKDHFVLNVLNNNKKFYWSDKRDFYEESEEVINRYSNELNLSKQERKFLIDWCNVNYNKKNLWKNKENYYTRDKIENLHNHIKLKLLKLKGKTY